MRISGRMIATLSISLTLLSTSVVAQAETSNDSLENTKQKLEQNEEKIIEKQKEQQSANDAINNIQGELQSLEEIIHNNQAELTSIEHKMETTYQLIEQKKEEIIILQDKTFERQKVMEKRFISLQHHDRTNLVIDTLINSESITNFVERIGAVATLLNADKELLDQQQVDLKQIEDDKKEIDEQEKQLASQQESLITKQDDLQQNIQKRNESLLAMEKSYQSLSKEVTLANQEKASIESQLSAIQTTIKNEQAAEKERAAKVAAAKKKEAIIVTQAPVQAPAKAQTVAAKPAKKESNSTNQEKPSQGRQLYVSATAYSHEDTASDITAAGYNIKKNANMKLIAVDPAIIPLGTKVWVEGYGVAIAGDTGGAIIGHKIDVLMPSSAQAIAWGRKTVKIEILD
ncbi:3D domain-containing protein [Metabacillus herbersteinensis]|uniref:3D domain-containing protein n=1 Tax=Metabacillus herbersteinensis TaxID=283816 RepID=A0ABV6GJ02_9BACI